MSTLLHRQTLFSCGYDYYLMCGTFTGVQLHRSGYVRDASRSFKINNFGGGYITFLPLHCLLCSVVRWSYQGEFILNPFSFLLFQS